MYHYFVFVTHCDAQAKYCGPKATSLLQQQKVCGTRVGSIILWWKHRQNAVVPQ